MPRHSRPRHPEEHAGGRAAQLRAGVLGANDGLLSTASLLVGVASAQASWEVLAATAVAGVVAGAGSMAIGEYSSVSSQRDAEHADLAKEQLELVEEPEDELAELAGIYRERGLPAPLALEVAKQLTEHDALGAHARDELGLDPEDLAKPVEAAVISAISFTLGALLPVAVALLAPETASVTVRVMAIVGASIVGLVALGALGARLGRAPMLRAALRVGLGGAAAMIIAWLIGQAFNVSVG